MNRASWSIVRRPNAQAGRNRLALRQAEAAVKRAPDNAIYLTTLGVAQYRLGRYPDALRTLKKPDAISAKQLGGSEPAALAFQAMAAEHLAQKEQTAATLARLRELLTKSARGAGKPGMQVFLDEAEELLVGHPTDRTPSGAGQ